MKIENLNMELLGRKFTSIVLASHHISHESVKTTVMSTLPVNSLEDEYIKDFLTLSTEEMIEKWFGGSLVAGSMIASKFADFFSSKKTP